MEYKNVEYIQDISFNDICDKMAISTTSKKIMIFQKIMKKSNDLIYINKKVKEEIKTPTNQNENSKNINFHNTFSFKSSSERKKRKSKERSNLNLSSKLNPNFNDSIELKTKQASSRNLITVDSNNEDTEDKNFLFKSLNFGSKNNFKLDRINLTNLNNEDSLDSSYGSPSILKYQKAKEYNYRWEQIACFTCDSPVLSLQWANNEFGNILACSGYNKCVFIFKEEKKENISNWKSCSKITLFSDIVSDISFLPESSGLKLATITSDGYLKIFYPLENIDNWESLYEDKISKSSGCTCLCCNPSNLDRLTIVVGCKKIRDEIKNDKININDEAKIKQMVKKQDSIIKNQSNDYLIKIVYFNDNIKNPLIENINENGHEDDITDVDWANQNGRLYHMICSTSKDGKFIIWKINLISEEFDKLDKDEDDDTTIKKEYFSYKKIYEFHHNKPLWRCSFNYSGVLASCLDEDGEVFVFFKTGKNEFVKLDINRNKI